MTTRKRVFPFHRLPVQLLIFIGLLFLPVIHSRSFAEEDLTSLIKRLSPCVVTIFTYDAEGNQDIQGTGFFISSKGEIVTNYHVIERAGSAKVRTASGEVFAITGIVAEDQANDLVKLVMNEEPEPAKETQPEGKKESFQPHPAVLSTSPPETGQRIFVIGNPLGLESTVSDGIVSAVREIPDFGTILQITAPLSPGSSGSPVFNLKGEVVGVATLVMQEGQNLNFAIPSCNVKNMKPWLETAEGQFWLGVDYAKNRQYEMAIKAFKSAIELQPDHADAYYRLGEICYMRAMSGFLDHFLGDLIPAAAKEGLTPTEVLDYYKTSEDAYQQAIRINPNYFEAHKDLGEVYRNTYRPEKAVESYKQAIRLKPDDGEVYSRMSMAYLDLHDYQNAIEASKKAIRLNPDNENSYFVLGQACDKASSCMQQIGFLEEITSSNPVCALAFSWLGIFYSGIDDFEKALKSYKQAVRLKPDDALYHDFLGSTYLKLGQRYEALEEYKVLKRLDPMLAESLFNEIYP